MVFLIDFFSVIFLLAGVCSQKTVRVKQGEVIGSTRMVRNVTVHSYLGIPYAEPPVGELRFKKPVPKAPWTSPINASDYGPICVQPPNPLLPYARSEDCLTLNVHVPESPVNTSMAVMVWVHGGGYIAGAARQWDPIGVTSMGVILVSINYRLGIFGFLNLGEHLKGNIGIWDQHLAFRWVKENIGAFGGDPERITIFGGSAGAMSVSIHAMSPQSTGLFHRVIGQSGMGMKAVSQKKTPTPTQITRVSLVSGCGTDDVVKLANCLRNKNTNELLFASFGLIGTGLLAPTVDNEFITKLVEDEQFVQSYGDYDYMMGSNNQDGNLAFINATTRATFQNGITNEMFESTIDRASLIYGYRSDAITSATLQEYTGDLTSADNTTRLRRLSEALGDATFTVPAQVNAVKHSMTNGTGSTYLYFLSMNSCTKLLPSFSWLEGSGHSDDLLYMTGVLEVLCNATDADRTLEKAMMTYWTNFAKTGNPNLPEAVPTTWPMFDHTQRQYLELNVNITAQANLKPRRMSFWNNVVQTLVESSSKVDCDDEVTGTPVDTVVETLYGKLRGKRESVKDWFWDVYLGIPYAAPPVGARRFLPPVPPSMWNGVRNVTEFGFACHGGPSYPGGPTLTFHEDCLSLNIYVPGGVEMWKEEKLAVMLFIHGGGYSIGSGSEYDGRALSWLGRVIVVTINYRLGIFGFASTGDQNAPGNVGLMDQSLAMRWVKHNIASFGGDPKRITIFGQSAGAGAVVYQVLSPMSAGLFQRAIAESSWGGAWDLHFTDPGKKNNIELIREYGKRFNCSSSTTDLMQCLRKVKASDIAQASAYLMVANPISPTVDGTFIPYSPSEMFDLLLKHKDTINTEDMADLLIGTNNGEGLTLYMGTTLPLFNDTKFSSGLTEEEFQQAVKSFVALNVGSNVDAVTAMIQNAYTNWDTPQTPQDRLRAFQELYADVWIVAGSMLAAQVHSSLGGNTYVYSFAHEPSFGHLLSPMGQSGAAIYGVAFHGDELPFVFGYPLATEITPMNVSSRDIEVSRQVIAYWSNFARYGSPNGPTVDTYWPEYETSTNLYMQIGKETEVKRNLGGSRLNLLTTVVRSLADSESCTEKPGMMSWPTLANNADITPYIMSDQPEVVTKFGRLRGFSMRLSALNGARDADIYLSIPYAKPPTGNRRFKKPESTDAWTGTLNVTEMKPSCPQRPTDLMKTLGLNNTSEDCLHLSVVVPRGSSGNVKKPVVIFIHNGFFLTGSPYEHLLGTISSLGDIITVGFNYRLGMLGFMSTGDDTLKGNLGLYDMVAAIKWVKENIAAFGGSPDNITLYGPGSGGLAVLHMMASPQAKDYFHQAILIDPSTPHVIDTPANLAEISRNFSVGIGCRQESSTELLECLRSKPADSFVYTGNPALSRQVFLVPDGDLIPTDLLSTYAAASSQPSKSIIIGSTSDYTDFFLQQYLGTRDSMTQYEVEGSIDMVIASTFPDSNMKDVVKSMIKQQFFSSKIENDKDRLKAMRHFYNSAHKYGWLYLVGQRQASAGADVFMYEFSHRPQWSVYPQWVGATFMDDLPYVEGFPFDPIYQAAVSVSTTDQDRMVSETMMTYLGNFVQTGNPNKGRYQMSVQWPMFEKEDPQYLMAGLRFMAMDMREKMGQEQIRFWNGEGDRSPLLYQVAAMQRNAETVTNAAMDDPIAVTCPPALGTSDFLNSLNLGVKGVEDLVLALIVTSSVLGLFLLIAIGYVCIMKSKLGTMKKAADRNSKTELYKM